MQSDRVILVPGPPDHVDIVNEVYRRYLAGEQQASLVSALNERGDFQLSGRPWTIGAMHRMLTSECYIGNIVWGKLDGKLGRSRRDVPKSQWIRKESAFPYVVEPSLFRQVQVEMARRKGRVSADEVLTGLRHLLKKHGTLTKELIDKADGVASTPTIARRFGSLKAAYEKVGFNSVPSNKYMKINRRISALAAKLGKVFAKQLCKPQLQHMGLACRLDQDGNRVVVLLARYIDRIAGPTQWYVQWDKLEYADAAVIGLMDARNTKVSSYHVVTGTDIAELLHRKTRDDGRCLHAFACSNLSRCVTEVATYLNRLS